MLVRGVWWRWACCRWRAWWVALTLGLPCSCALPCLGRSVAQVRPHGLPAPRCWACCLCWWPWVLFLVVILALGLPCSCSLPGPSCGLLGVLLVLVLWVCCPGVALLAASTTLVVRDLVALGVLPLAFLVVVALALGLPRSCALPGPSCGRGGSVCPGAGCQRHADGPVWPLPPVLVRGVWWRWARCRWRAWWVALALGLPCSCVLPGQCLLALLPCCGRCPGAAPRAASATLVGKRCIVWVALVASVGYQGFKL